MMNNYFWERKEKGSGNYGSRGDWGHRSSANRRPPQARQKSVPSWEKKFCESICLIPWHKLLEAKKFMHLYDNVVRWNDTAAEEAFKNAKSRFWAEMNGLPCNVKSPDPDTYIDKVDWNTSVDPELLLDLERGPDVESKTSEAESEIVNNGKPFLLDNEPFLCDEGWGYLDKVPVPPNGSAESQGWINWNEADQCGENLEGSKGWNNWDDYDDDDKNNKYASNCNWEEIGYKNSWNEDSYGKSNMASGRSDPWQGSVYQVHSNPCAYGGQGGEWNNRNGWDHSHYSPGKNVAIDGGRNQDPLNNHWRRKESEGYWQNRGFKNSGGRKKPERPRWVDRNPSYGRW